MEIKLSLVLGLKVNNTSNLDLSFNLQFSKLVNNLPHTLNLTTYGSDSDVMNLD